MSFAVCHMEKYKRQDVKGIQFHNQRERESHTNSDIKRDQSHLNYDLLHPEKVDYTQLLKQQLKDRVQTNKKIRKDAVMLCSFLITSDKPFFEGLSPDEEQRFFKESLAFFQNRYGSENIVYATVHKDEKTPHMHVGMIPITEDGRLAAKSFFGKKTELKQVQDQFHHHLTQAGFSLERGLSSDRKHLETARFKAQTTRDEIKTLESTLTEKQHQKKELEATIQEVEERLTVLEGDLRDVSEHGKLISRIEAKKPMMSRESVLIKQEDFVSLQLMAKKVPILARQANQLENENESLKEKVSGLEFQKDTLKKENNKLKTMLNKVQHFFKQHDLFSKFDEFLQRFSKEKDQKIDLDR
ncbi:MULTISPECIES: MobV family relaxase [Bacillales]|uniref:MobV family relaxase n=1 Tax=Fictibacillus terranigra TaxID=3058424 RepID=A0ABT8EED2_9BACL|nr:MULTISPECIES: MobV family relaxase [Bacillales]MDN4076292.1 MobV family relaxase [Fictibacillus sp. CENA-BCM004]MDN4086229.1 MobV family relaxase [Paenibacillus polymyxa]